MKRYTHMVLSPSAWIWCAVVLMCVFGQPVLAQDEIAPFRLTGIDGHVEMRYRQDKETNGDAGTSSTTKRTTTEEELYLLTHSYVYHPNFLKMDLGIGPLFSQYKLDTDTASVSDSTADYNLNALLRFLDEKPYPFQLYYNRQHPIVSLSLTDRFQQKSEKYGFDFQLRQPAIPFNLSLGASHHRTEGQGFDLRIRDTIDQATMRAQIPFSQAGYAQFVFNTTNARSETGYLSQPVVATETRTDNYTLDSRLYFGSHSQFQLSNYLTRTEQGGDRPVNEWRYSPYLRWIHSDNLESYYRMNYLSSDQVTVTSRDVGAATGFRYKKSDALGLNGEVHGDKATSTGLDLNSYGVTGNLAYRKEYSFGVFNFSAGLGADHFNRVANVIVPVRNLSMNLSGTTPAFLPNDNIDRATIVVYRVFSGGTQTLLTVGVDTICDGTIDILVKSIDARTTIENCNGALQGDIQVSVSYDYNPGGSVAYLNVNQSYDVNLQLYKNYTIYAHYRQNSVSIQSGMPTQPLGESKNRRLGARMDYPLYRSLRIGGEVVYEKEDGTLYSYVRDSAEVHFQFTLLGGLFHASTQHVNTDYANTTQDINLVRNTLQFRVRPWNRVGLLAELSQEDQTSGDTERRTRVAVLTAEWRLRKLNMQAEARRVLDTYGVTDRERSLVRFILRRDF